MAPLFSPFVAFFLVVVAGVASPRAAAFNITRILGEFPDFATFNSLLTQNKLADEINRRQTITVLAVDNGAAGGISSLPSDVQRKVLSMHVVLDYYDEAKLGAIKNHSTLLTTLFQSSGHATDRMGFLNFTKRAGDGAMVFGSAEPGAQHTSQIVKSVAKRPYNISVLQVSAAIVPPGVGGSADGGAPPPHSKGGKEAPPPDGDEEAAAPGPSDDGGSADAPGPAADGPTADGPTADGPAADGPAAEGPAADGPAADGPAADGPAADGPAEADAPGHEKSSDNPADAPEGSAAGRVVGGAGLGIVALLMIITI